MPEPILYKGIGVVWGIPKEVKPISGLPPGKVKLRFRQNNKGMAFVKDEDGLRSYCIAIDIEPPNTLATGNWYAIETGRNVCLNRGRS